MAAALWMLRGQLPAIAEVARSTRPRWSLVLAASAVVLLTYALLIESWRRVVQSLGGRLSSGVAAVIWLVSSLARYIPGVGLQLGAMMEMTRRRGVPVTVSTSAAIVIYVVNLFTGIAVFALTSAASPALSARGYWLLGAGGLLLAVAPVALPPLARLATRVTGREIAVPTFGLKPVLIAAVSTTVSWVAYGIAFWLLADALLPGQPRTLAGCIALYTGSYIAGLLNVMPAGLGAAEAALIVLAPRLGVATGAEAVVLATAVRIWRTALEVLPGVAALPFTTRLQRADSQPSRGSRIP